MRARTRAFSGLLQAGDGRPRGPRSTSTPLQSARRPEQKVAKIVPHTPPLPRYARSWRFGWSSGHRAALAATRHESDSCQSRSAHARSWRFGWSSGFDRLAWLACLERARIRGSRKIALGSNPVDTMRSRRSLGERGPTPPSPRTSPSVMIPACLGYCFLSRLP